MIDFIKLGMMVAEFRDACSAIDRRAAEVGKDRLSSAFQALLTGDTVGRDRHCDMATKVDETARRAKTEAWLRVGEKYGLDRETAERLLKDNRLLN